jgi:acyl-CoA reductase-like NAD-dependent aldehyde dehydrogenase
MIEVFETQTGEILTTLEKARWTINNGERYLRPDKRNPPLLLMHKKAQVEYEPIGVIGAIVPWVYLFQ